MQNFNPTQPIKKKKGCGTIILYVVLVFIAVSIVAALFSDDEKNQQTTEQSESGTIENVSTDNSNIKRVGETLNTQYFDVTVNNVEISDRINTGNQFANVTAEDGNAFLIMNTTFKNTSNESRMILEGSLFIDYNGKNYEFDKTETIMAEGWGLIFDQINPLTTKKTNLVYTIPKEIKGKIFWNPGRSESNQLIYLGEIE